MNDNSNWKSMYLTRVEYLEKAVSEGSERHRVLVSIADEIEAARARGYATGDFEQLEIPEEIRRWPLYLESENQ